MTSLDHSLSWTPSSLRACILPTQPPPPAPPLCSHLLQINFPSEPLLIISTPSTSSLRTPFTLGSHSTIKGAFLHGCSLLQICTHVFSWVCWLFFYVLSLSGSSLLLYFRFYKIRGPSHHLLQNQNVHSTGSHVILWFLWLPGVLLSPDVPLNHLMVLVNAASRVELEMLHFSQAPRNQDLLVYRVTLGVARS